MTQPHIDTIITNTLVSPQIVPDNEEEVFDLNEALITLMQKYSDEDHKNFIVRFDNLPVVFGNKDHLTCILDALISMITSHPPNNSKLFLYVNCAEEKLDNEIVDLNTEPEKKLYKIDFYTNINTDEHWKAIYNSKLSECSLLGTQVGGKFSFYPISNTGCLFSVLLQGKTN